jgi:enoyl-CoA hydratase
VDYETLIVEQERGRARITLNRPEKLNAFNAEMVDGLMEAIRHVGADTSCRAVVLTGAGRGFCSGTDLRDYDGDAPRAVERDDQRSGWAIQKHVVALLSSLRRMPQPVVAAVNGPAIGAGLGLVLHSDIRLASASARFGVPGKNIGMTSGDLGISWLLPRIVGLARSQELMLTMRMCDAEEAYRIGLVVEVHPDGRLLGAALEKAALLASLPALAIELSKEAAWAGVESASLEGSIDLENRQQALISSSADHREALQAFNERRDPVFNRPPVG